MSIAPFERRTALLLGEEGVDALHKAHVILFGVGGVGGYVAEALARAGIGKLTLVDDDTIAESNRNRQLIALTDTVGENKVAVAARRIKAINPDCQVVQKQLFYMPETADEVNFEDASYVVDAVDTVTAKLEIIGRALRTGVPVISSMGTGNKLHPELLNFEDASYVVDAVDTVTAKLEIIGRALRTGVPVISSMGTGNKLHPELLTLTTIEKTTACPLARVMRRECRARGYKNIPVVYSTEPALTPKNIDGPAEAPANAENRPGNPKKQTPGSVSFVPGAAGLIIAGKVVRDLTGQP